MPPLSERAGSRDALDVPGDDHDHGEHGHDDQDDHDHDEDEHDEDEHDDDGEDEDATARQLAHRGRQRVAVDPADDPEQLDPVTAPEDLCPARHVELVRAVVVEQVHVKTDALHLRRHAPRHDPFN